MKLTAQVKLLPSPEQYQMLKQTLETSNNACNYISERGWNNKTIKQFPLHKLVYHDVRKRFPLTAQIVVRIIAKVADAYKVDQKVMRTFKPLGAISYDSRILSYNLEQMIVNIWTITGRQKIPFVCGQHQMNLLQGQRGESDLCFVNGKFYLMATCDIETPELIDVDDILGIDMGIVSLTTDSDNESYSGKEVENIRRKFLHRRRNLQSNGSKSAIRKLKKISGKQARFQNITNHVISKHVVQKAQYTHRAIGLEDLTGIREAKVRRRQRAQHSNWSFYDLRSKIEYKAKRAGIPVILVDPRNTSRACSRCGYIDKANRKSQSSFLCISCGYADNADYNAARNIRARAIVNLPMVSTLAGQGQNPRIYP